jgi:hypothetical protein
VCFIVVMCGLELPRWPRGVECRFTSTSIKERRSFYLKILIFHALLKTKGKTLLQKKPLNFLIRRLIHFTLCLALNPSSNSDEFSSVASSSTEFSSPSKMMKKSEVGDLAEKQFEFEERKEKTHHDMNVALRERRLEYEERKEKTRHEMNVALRERRLELEERRFELEERRLEFEEQKEKNREQEIQNAKMILELQRKNNERMLMALSRFMENQPAPPK